MSKRGDGAEKRQFGRRQTNMRGWIRVAGRPPVPCILSNVSEGGALLHIDQDFWIPFSFRLTTEDKSIDRVVEVRHQRSRSIGVEFMAQAATQVSQSVIKPIANTDDTWMARSTRYPLR